MNGTAAQSEGRWRAGLFALLAVALLLAYAPALSGGFLWDDDAHVTAPALRSVGGLVRIWFDLGATQQYYPLLHSFFWLEHRLFGDGVAAYHLVGVLLHALNGLLLAMLLRRLGVSRVAASIAALVWALHPVMVESVAWITEQKNTLSGVFYVGAFLAWLRFDEERRASWWWIASALFLAALLSKSVTATLPAVILILLWWKQGSLSFTRDVRPLIPWFVTGVMAGLFTSWVERRFIGAEGAAFALSWPSRFVLAGRVVWFYLGKLAWPNDLVFIYPRWTVTATSPAAWLPFVGVLVLFAVAAWRSRVCRLSLAALSAFVITLAPVLGFFNVYPFLYSYVADHFQYLASAMLLAPAAAGAVTLAERRKDASAPVVRGALVVVVALFAFLTWRQAGSYASAETLYRRTLARNPSCWMAQVLLGTIVHGEGKLDEAADLYTRAAEIYPPFIGSHLNLGNLKMQQGKPLEALTAYRRALSLHPDDPLANMDVASALASLGRWTEAIPLYEKALATGSLGAMEADTRFGLGSSLVRVGRPMEAIPHFEAATRLDPSRAAAHTALGTLLLASGDAGRAADEFRLALARTPDDADALNGLAWILATDEARRDPAQAVRLAERAATLSARRDPHVLDTLAAAYQAAGRRDEAITCVREALGLADANADSELVSGLRSRLRELSADR